MFVNKVDASNDKEIEELVELEVRELLAKYNYDGDNASIIFGSALHALQGTRPEIGKQRVLQLLQAMDDNIKVPKRDVDKPFVLSIEGTYQIAGRGTVVTGTVDSGKVKVGDEVEIIGYSNKVHKTVVTGVETFKKSLDFGEAGDNIGVSAFPFVCFPVGEGATASERAPRIMACDAVKNYKQSIEIF